MRLSHLALIAMLSLGAAAPAVSAPPPAAPAEPGAVDEKEAARSVEFQGLVFPVFSETGKLKNYIFVNARMRVADGKDPWKYREKAHFIRDAILRAAHRTSFNVAGDFNKLDEKKAEKECLKAANDIMGEQGSLVSMTFNTIASQASVL